VPEWLGSDAIIFVNAHADDHVRVAIQAVSTNKDQRTEYAHTGWRKINDAWVYLHGNGAIGANGPVENIHVALPRELAAFQLPDPLDNPREAIKASLEFFNLGPDRITIPGFGSALGAFLSGANFSVLFLGMSGVFKTEISALLQQNVGAGFNSRSLPTSFASTANFNEALAFACKDAPMAVDDFHPPASGSERERMLRDTTRLFRAQGNQAGRGRMTSDRSLKSAEWPRGLIVATGEDQLPGHSLNSRLLVLEILKGDIDKTRLTACQRHAAAGLYAQTTAAFIKWLAADFPKVQDWFHQEVSRLQLTFSHHHPRAAGIQAQLSATYAIFTEFLADAGIFKSKAKQREFIQRVRSALKEAADAQQNFAGASANPCNQFQQLLISAIASGSAHLAKPNGSEPRDPKLAIACGWRSEVVSHGEDAEVRWRPRGLLQIGWVEKDTNGLQLYLDPTASYAAAQKMAADGNGVEVSIETLKRRLKEAGLLAETDTKRETITVRRTLGGSRKDMLHFPAKFLNLGDDPETPDPQKQASEAQKEASEGSDP
jgi:hypothetical protein